MTSHYIVARGFEIVFIRNRPSFLLIVLMSLATIAETIARRIIEFLNHTLNNLPKGDLRKNMTIYPSFGKQKFPMTIYSFIFEFFLPNWGK